MSDKVQGFRDSMRPFLTMWFSFIFAAALFLGIFLNRIDIKEALSTTESILLIILGYHFGKSSKRDTVE
ncbi:MAG: hypothetical protein Q8P20_00990 [bacterium]|nr:hypothetical protein [bacterium]